jgi:hypothetical protein
VFGNCNPRSGVRNSDAAYLTDKLSVYLNDKPSPQELRPYEVFVIEAGTADISSSNTKSTARDPEAYCGESGSEMLHQDLSTALDSILN